LCLAGVEYNGGRHSLVFDLLSGGAVAQKEAKKLPPQLLPTFCQTPPGFLCDSDAEFMPSALMEI